MLLLLLAALKCVVAVSLESQMPFTTKQQQTTHEDAVHKKIRFDCEQCDKSYSRKDSLTAHQKTHSGKLLVCQWCNITFTTKNQQTTHEDAVHKKIRFDCEQCDKSYSRKYSLTTHQRTHSGKLLVCQWCDKPCSTKQQRKRHEDAVHSKIRFYCELCGKSYSRKDSWSKHQKTHSGNTPDDPGVTHECPHCNKHFLKENLQMHQESAHQNVFNCNLAPKNPEPFVFTP